MNNISPAVLRLVAALPVVAGEPAIQHSAVTRQQTSFRSSLPALVIALRGTAAIG